MKLYLSYILFFAFALRPIYNIGYVAYFQLNIDYIIETYCINKEKPELQCNGKCHLGSQLAVSSTDSTEDSSFLSSIFEAFIPVYFHKNKSHACIKPSIDLVENNWNYNKTFSSLFEDIINPPPQV